MTLTLDTRPETGKSQHPRCSNCTWCNGTGEVTDPDGRKWPCIQCNG